MTFSILTRDPATGDLGAATATGTPAVGGFVLHRLAGVGALATQGWATNTLYGATGIRMLEDGAEAGQVLQTLTEGDRGRDWRQLIVIDRDGQTAGWTGPSNEDAKLHICEPNLAVAGNWLGSEEVVRDMRSAYLDADGLPMIERLLAALRAADLAGGDSRGARSAAAMVVSRRSAPMDLRVDLHDDPITRIHEIYDIVEDAEFQKFVNRMPTVDEPMRH